VAAEGVLSRVMGDGSGIEAALASSLSLSVGSIRWIYPLDLSVGYARWICPAAAALASSLSLSVGSIRWIYPLDLPLDLPRCCYPCLLVGSIRWIYPLDLPTGSALLPPPLPPVSVLPHST
jgi:hypothetical protein